MERCEERAAAIMREEGGMDAPAAVEGGGVEAEAGEAAADVAAPAAAAAMAAPAAEAARDGEGGGAGLIGEPPPLSLRPVVFVPAGCAAEAADYAEEVEEEEAVLGEEVGGETDAESVASSGERAARGRAGEEDVAEEWAGIARERARLQEERERLLSAESARTQAARAEGERAWEAMKAERWAAAERRACRPFAHTLARMHGVDGLEGEDAMEAPWAAMGRPPDFGAWWVEEEARAEAAWRAG